MLLNEKADFQHHKSFCLTVCLIPDRVWNMGFKEESSPKLAVPTQNHEMYHRSACRKHIFYSKIKDTMSDSNVWMELM